jgi:signal transduction histidine kinase
LQRRDRPVQARGGIFQNLISNAIKFTPGGKINLAAKREKNRVTFEINDTGIGIPPSKMEKLFKALETLDYSLNREHQGAGPGLAIVKSYVDALGGGIEVTSEENTGTTFKFWIPA